MENYKTKLIERRNDQVGMLAKSYSPKFLKKILRLFQIFCSVSTKSGNVLNMIQNFATPNHICCLLKLLLNAPPQEKISVIVIIQNLLKVSIPSQIFEEAIELLTEDKNSLAI